MLSVNGVMMVHRMYRAFILRMWTEKGDWQDEPEPCWHFSLEPIGAQVDRRRRGFASADQVATYLQEVSANLLQDEVIQCTSDWQ